ncbi:MAG: glycosyltransferase [candidate division KSB1 bacterium]|nr:glycosyltransferase [candidate division KSB1 bacterium]
MKGLEEGMVMGLADEASPKARTRVPTISVIVALRNHASLLSSLCADLLAVLKELGGPFEIVLVDDGSTDTTYAQAELLARSHRSVKAVRLRSTFGEGSAFDAGLKVARGRTIVYMAGRVLTDPHGVRALVEKLAEGADLVMAWRHPRRDSRINRVVSFVFNQLVNRLAGLQLHDINSGMFATRREVLDDLPLYGDMHNFLPVLAARQGYKVAEAKVQQLPGTFRKSIYPEEYVRRLLDIITVLFLTNYAKKPLHFLGFMGGIFALVGALIELYLFVYRVLAIGPIAGRPLLLLGALLLVIGLQMISIGLIGEMIIFTHARDIKEYNIAEIIE